MEARRERTDVELFDGEPPPDGLRPLADVIAAWPDQDYVDIAKELGAKRDQVSFVVHTAHRHEGRKLIEAYALTGSAGVGADYDPASDARAAQRTVQQVMAAGASAITAAAAAPAKKS